jgi:hypothetical protein
MLGELMRAILSLDVLCLLACVTTPSFAAPYSCHHDPLCQANRDGTSAQRRGNGRSGGECRRIVGFTEEQWRAGQTTSAQRRAWDKCMGRS